jgi:hypothetical protein
VFRGQRIVEENGQRMVTDKVMVRGSCMGLGGKHISVQSLHSLHSLHLLVDALALYTCCTNCTAALLHYRTYCTYCIYCIYCTYYIYCTALSSHRLRSVQQVVLLIHTKYTPNTHQMRTRFHTAYLHT